MNRQRHFNKIFGIGLSKTGTTSLGRALAMLGVATIDYPHDPVTLGQLERGDYRLNILESFDAVTDTPVAPYYPQFDEIYPGSKFILTVRDKQRWLKSAETHWRFREAWCRQNEDFRRFSYFICTAVYGTVDFSQTRFSHVYDTHLRNVSEYFRGREDDLLVLDICNGEGWERLCPFLGLDEPGRPFPFLNRKEEKTERRRWVDNLDRAHEELTSVASSDATLILADDGKIAGSTIQASWTCLPFTERDGLYWGPPADDRHAVNELERLREQGGRFLAVVWPAHWWLEHYRGFAEHLESRYCRVLSNDRIVVFDLRSRRASL